ncbi:MAG: class I SAM-dependent methyltransferase [Patescibacteria group bacterium]|nr:class I SAM-dependent methyltransferase [Patescibacteria group bacterium]MDE1945776.1 class I SAM-dependent methyltransferase [Patescibacteria group bacterium]
MIPIFIKLQSEKLLKPAGSILDLGSGAGKLSEPFLKAGYHATLVDTDAGALAKAKENFRTYHANSFALLHEPIEKFAFHDPYDGILAVNVLSFQKDKMEISRIVQDAFSHVKTGGFFYFTLFGTKDDWANSHADRMSFYEKDEALSILDQKPYFLSEDYGTGSTMKGDLKTWHVFHLLYVKD